MKRVILSPSQKRGGNMLKKLFILALLTAGIGFAEFSIPADQPICNLYGLIKTIGTVAGVLVAAYAGLILASTTEIGERNQAKTLIGGVAVGLIIIWIAPILITSLVGADSICGWDTG